MYLNEITTKDPLLLKYIQIFQGADTEMKLRFFFIVNQLKRITNADLIYILGLKDSTVSRILVAMERQGIFETQNIFQKQRWYFFTEHGQAFCDWLVQQIGEKSETINSDLVRVKELKRAGELPSQKLAHTIDEMKKASDAKEQQTLSKKIK